VIFPYTTHRPAAAVRFHVTVNFYASLFAFDADVLRAVRDVFDAVFHFITVAMIFRLEDPADEIMYFVEKPPSVACMQ